MTSFKRGNENQMTETKSEWQTEELTAAFLKGVRGAIPGADMQLAVMGKIVELWSPEPVAILDLGCGNGILGQYLLDIFPASRGVFVDFAVPMLDAARENLGGNPRANFVQADFSSSQWLDTVSQQRPFDIVVSGFSIHHQPDERKKTLYAEIYDLLATGGVFLNLEHVASTSAAGVQLFDEFFIDHLYEFHSSSDPDTSREAIDKTYYSRPDKGENILAPVDDQCRWLAVIGFQDVDCFFKVFELALFGGRKPSD